MRSPVSPADEAAGEGEEGLRGCRRGGRCGRAVGGGCAARRRCARQPSGDGRARSRARSGGERSSASRRAARRGGGTCRGRSRGRRSASSAGASAVPTRPRTGGTRSSSSSSWVTSLRLPPVSVQASGMPPPSTSRWCLLPARPRSTGLGPVFWPLFSPAGGWSRRSPATTRAGRRRATRPAATRAARSQTPPAARRAAAARRSSRSRSQAPAADAEDLRYEVTGPFIELELLTGPLQEQPWTQGFSTRSSVGVLVLIS